MSMPTQVEYAGRVASGHKPPMLSGLCRQTEASVES